MIELRQSPRRSYRTPTPKKVLRTTRQMPRPKGPPKIRRQFHLLKETDARIKASISSKTPNASAVIDEKFMPTAPEPDSTLTPAAQRLVRLSSMRKGHQPKPRKTPSVN